MGRNSRYLGLVIFMCFTFALQAQDNRYVVFFSDKANSTYSLENPSAFLTQRALLRRERQHITLNYKDLPVSGAYLDSLDKAGIASFHTSKWLNAVLVQANSEKVHALENASYVDSIQYVAPGTKLNHPYSPISRYANTHKVGKNKEVTLDESGIILDQNIALGVDEMHEQGYKGKDMLIGVFDGGFTNANKNAAFETLYNENRVIATKNFVINNDSVYQYDEHGAKALSLIAGYIPKKFIGTAPEASFVLCVTEDVKGEYRIEEYNWLFAAEYADSLGVDIISTSLGYNLFTDPSMNYSYNDMDGKTAIITKASEIAASRGILLVTSAGNEGNNSWKYITAPADADSVLAIGAIVTATFNRAYFSSFGPTADDRIKPDVSAPGYAITTINGSGNLSLGNGTSFAAPLVAGFAAGFWQANPQLSNMEVLDRIRLSGSKARLPNNEIGYGVPNFKRAMNGEILALYSPPPKSFRVYPNPVTNNKLVVEMATPLYTTEVEAMLFDGKGKVIKKVTITGHPYPESFSLDFQDVMPGIYILNIITAHTSEAAKVIKF